MFQADSDFYQYTTATAAEGDSATTWQPTAEQVIQEGELIFRAQDGDGEADGSVVEETQHREEESEVVICEKGEEAAEVEAPPQVPTEGKDKAVAATTEGGKR